MSGGEWVIENGEGDDLCWNPVMGYRLNTSEEVPPGRRRKRWWGGRGVGATNFFDG